MKLRDLRIGWRLLLKEPGYSLAVVAGLAVGFAACFLLLGFVRYSLSYNSHLAGSDGIYVVKERRNMLPRPEWRATAPALLSDTVLASGSGADVTRARLYDLAARVDNRILPLPLRVVDANYLDFFGVKAVAGDATAALARPDMLVLSREMAVKLFGRAEGVSEMLGKVASIDGVPYRVGAILPDMPGNSTVAFGALVGPGMHRWDLPKPDDRPDRAWSKAAEVYVKPAPGAHPAALASLLQDAVTRNRDDRVTNAAWRARSPNGRLTDIGVTALSDLYFDPDLLRSRAGGNYGDKNAVAGLAALAVLILLLAGTNYVNLAAVRTVQRQREIGVRKVLGVSGRRLAGQFVAESMLVALLAAGAGLVLAWIAAPLFAELVNRPLQGMFSPLMCLAALAPAMLVGLLSALYPAWLALRLPARVTLHGRGDSETSGGLRLRRVLSIFQFAAAIALVGLTVVVAWQTDYASRADPGFDPAPLLVLVLPGDPRTPAAQSFQTELARLPGVDGVGAVSEAIGRDGRTVVSMLKRRDGTDVQMELKMVGPGFFRTLGVKAVHGRLFEEGRDRQGGGAVLLNAMAAHALGFATPEAALGQMVGSSQVVGIAPDLRYRTMRQAPEAMMYLLDPAQEVLTVRVASDTAAVRTQIEALWRQHFPNELLDIESASSVFAENYNEDRRLAKMLASASGVAISLASFGIYVLSAYSVRRRAREFVLRKIHGASGAAIGRLVVREFAVLIAAGAAVGVPLAWLGGERYLAGFVERAPMGAWPQLGALGLVALIALASTARHTLAAMRVAPAAALRN